MFSFLTCIKGFSFLFFRSFSASIIQRPNPGSCYRAESRAHNAGVQGLLIRFLLLTIQRPFLSDPVRKNCELESAFVQGL